MDGVTNYGRVCVPQGFLLNGQRTAEGQARPRPRPYQSTLHHTISDQTKLFIQPSTHNLCILKRAKYKKIQKKKKKYKKLNVDSI